MTGWWSAPFVLCFKYRYLEINEWETPSASALGRSRHAYFDNCGVYPQCEDLIVEMGEFINSHAKQA